MSSLTGKDVKSINPRAMFFVVCLMGFGAFGSVLYWRSQTLLVAEYQDFPRHEIVLAGEKGEMKSSNYQLDVEEFGPR